MTIKAILFDINGTMVHIETNESDENIFRVIKRILTYQGIRAKRSDLEAMYREIVKEQKKSSNEKHPEFNAVGVFREIIRRLATDFTRGLPAEQLNHLPLFLAQTYRAASRQKLKTYPGVEDTIKHLHAKYRLGIVSDAQSAYARAELHHVGLTHFFHPVIVSGDYGFRKPDKRMFRFALETMGVSAQETVYVGNDIYRDVHGARKLGLKTVLFKSNQGRHHKEGVEADYVVHEFPEVLKAIKFFERQ